MTYDIGVPARVADTVPAPVLPEAVVVGVAIDYGINRYQHICLSFGTTVTDRRGTQANL